MSAPLNVLELFAGIGGLSLGLERAGMNVVGQVEIDPFCQRVLAKHWPEVPRHDDVRTAVEWWRSEPRPRVDVVAGGPPCQPFSQMGRQRGIADPRWMWPAMADVVRAVRPRYVVMENTPRLVRDGDAFGWILGDISELGFDAEWSVLSACSFGAPHTRERLFVLAYADAFDGRARLGREQEQRFSALTGGSPESVRCGTEAGAWRDRVDWAVASASADGRDADGLAVAMVAAGGNAVVPAVAEHIGRLIVTSQAREVAA